jgi:hypothetical protein
MASRARNKLTVKQVGAITAEGSFPMAAASTFVRGVTAATAVHRSAGREAN